MPQHLSVDLQRLLDEHGEDGIGFGELVDRLGDRGYGFSLLLLALPSALPVPAAGYSTPFGIAIVGLAAQMMLGRSEPWLPGWIRGRRLEGAFARKMLATAIGALRRVEHLIRPRGRLVRGRAGLTIAGLLIAAMGCLMILPLPGTNTAPAMAIFLVAVGLVEEDGVVVGLGAFAAACGVLLYGALFTWMFRASMNWEQTYEAAKALVKGLLGS